MSDKAQLHERLDALAAKLANATERLELKGKLKDGGHLNNADLQARYELLKSNVNQEISDFEAHGHHVGALEEDVMTWLQSIDLDS